MPYGPVVPEQDMTYQAHQFQIVNAEQYQQLNQQGQLSQLGGGLQQNVEVLPEVPKVLGKQQIEGAVYSNSKISATTV